MQFSALIILWSVASCKSGRKFVPEKRYCGVDGVRAGCYNKPQRSYQGLRYRGNCGSYTKDALCFWNTILEMGHINQEEGNGTEDSRAICAQS